MAATNQKSVIDTHTEKKKESKHNINITHQITREQKKKKCEELPFPSSSTTYYELYDLEQSTELK